MQLKSLILAFGPILLLSPFLIERMRVVVLLFSTPPSKLERFQAFNSHTVKFDDRVRSCEDVLLIEDKGLAVLACDAGREKYNTVMGLSLAGPVQNAALWIYDYADTDALMEIELVGFTGDFHTLGIAYHGPSSTLFAVNHSTDGPRIEAFNLDLSGERPVATHKRTIRHPLLRTPNSISVINEHELYVTNDHYFTALHNPYLSRIETYLGIPSGGVVHIDLATDTYRMVARVPFANGVDLLNSTTLAVASSSKAVVSVYSVDPTSHDLALRSTVRFPFGVDNLSVDKDGKLLAAGHTHMPSLSVFSATRWLCNSDESKDEDREVCKTTVAGSAVAEWTEQGGVKMLYSGTEYPTACTAARDVQRKTVIVSGLYAKGILVWKE